MGLSAVQGALGKGLPKPSALQSITRSWNSEKDHRSYVVFPTMKYDSGCVLKFRGEPSVETRSGAMCGMNCICNIYIYICVFQFCSICCYGRPPGCEVSSNMYNR